MTQEDKELLLVDLCARIPYKVKVSIPIPSNIIGQPAYTGPIELTSLNPIKKDCSVGDVYSQVSGLRIYDRFGEPLIKPYLRPMSSMTKEEYEKYDSKRKHIYDEYNRYCFDSAESIDWLNANHFDYRGLIEKDLAIAVTKENNPYV